MVQTEISSRHRLSGVTFLAIVNAIGLFLTILFWGFVLVRRLVPLPGALHSMAERASSAVTYGFLIGDMFYSVPLLFLSWIGLWRMKNWGWLAAQMVNALWIYSMTVILLRDAYTTISPGGLLFIPFVVVSLWSLPYLWIHRGRFGIID